MKKSTLLIFLSLIGFGVWAQEKQTPIQNAEENLNHAYTYYWLSRARGNDHVDIDATISYYEKVLSVLKDNDSVKAQKLKFQAEEGLNHSLEMKEASAEDIINTSPLLPLLAGFDFLIEHWESHEDTARENSMSAVYENLLKQLPLKSQVYTVALAADGDLSAEEEIHRYLNSSTSFYVISRHELASALEADEIKSLYEDDIPAGVLNKLADAFQTDSIGLFKVAQNDLVDNIAYYGTTFRYWNKEQQKWRRLEYADGFAEDETSKPLLAFLLLLICLPLTWIYNKLSDRHRDGSRPPLWMGLAFSIATVVFGFFAAYGFNSVEFDLSESISRPAGLLMIVIFVGTYAVLPLIVNYLIASRLKVTRDILNNTDTIASIFSGTYLGLAVFLFYQSQVRGALPQSLEVTVFAISSYAVATYAFAYYFNKAWNHEEKLASTSYALILLITCAFTAILLHWDQNQIRISSAILAISSWLLPWLFSLSSHWLAKFKRTSDGNKKELSGLALLRQNIDHPPFIKHKNLENQLLEACDFITEDKDSRLEMIFIEADYGFGKTRTALEIAESVRKSYEKQSIKCEVLFGDCDEVENEAEAVPYEPFIQALGERLGIKRLENPAEKARKLQDAMANTGLNAALGTFGLGGLGSLLEADESEGVCHASADELAKVVSTALNRLAEKGRMIFILDDVQWMDSSTFELFQRLLEKLNRDFNDNQISFILTARTTPTESLLRVKGLIAEMKQESTINLLEINERAFENETMFSDLIETLHFTQRSSHQLCALFSERGFSKPLHVLETLKTVLDKSWIKPEGSYFSLSSDAELAQLPSPDDYQQMVAERLNGLDERVLEVLKCCSLIGREFRVSLVAKIFQLDVLELLTLLKTAQMKGLVRDIAEVDDVFDFTDKRTIAIFRELSRSGSGQLSQMAREYHKRFVDIRCQQIDLDGTNPQDLPYREILDMAYHSAHIKESYFEQALLFNKLAAEQSYARARFGLAQEKYDQCLQLVEEFSCRFSDAEKISLLLSYSKCLLDAQMFPEKVEHCLKRISQITEGQQVDINTEADIKLVHALFFYRQAITNPAFFTKALELSEEVLASQGIDEELRLRAKFFRAASLSPRPLEEAHKRAVAHEEVIADIDRLTSTKISRSDKTAVMKIKAEASNNLGFTYLFNTQEVDKASPFFQKAIEINALPEINDRKGLGIAHGGLGDCYQKKGDLEKAEQSFLVNLEISSENDDSQGICRMNGKLGEIYLETAEENKLASDKDESLKQARRYFDNSLTQALESNHVINQLFALKGLLQCSVARNLEEDCRFAIKEIDKTCQSVTDVGGSVPPFLLEILSAEKDKAEKFFQSVVLK